VTHTLEALSGGSVLATDGEIGHVRNFLFDDQTWTVRYIVVDVRSWMSRHDVLIAVSALDEPAWASPFFRANLTRDQVRRSPDVDSEKPVARQQEIAMREYYGWPSSWTKLSIELPLVSIPAGREFPAKAPANSHLRSVNDLTGYSVWSDDREVGRLENFIVDKSSWHLGYLDVKTGNWLYSHSVLIPTRWVKDISWADHRVNLRHVPEARKYSTGSESVGSGSVGLKRV
jgi:uncharacterized protein YrrD